MHGDLKLENILIGKTDPENIYLIDFGLSTSFKDHRGNHIKKEYTEQFSGNILFASLNSCRYKTKSRRDDLESLMYILIFLLHDC